MKAAPSDANSFIPVSLEVSNMGRMGAGVHWGNMGWGPEMTRDEGLQVWLCRGALKLLEALPLGLSSCMAQTLHIHRWLISALLTAALSWERG